MYDISSLLAVDGGAAVMLLKKSVIPHKHVRRVVFGGLPVVAGEVVRYYDGTFVCYDLSVQKRLKKTYGECVMVATVRLSSKWVVKIPDTILSERSIEQTSWIAPARLCCKWCINDATYL